jgi:hypothetical protein
MDPQIRNLFYILAAVLFIFGIKGLTHPRTAVRGNLLGALGMFVAIVVTVIDKQMIGWGWIIAGVIIGGGIGAVLAVKIQMTGMPQLVALYNGFGGIASVFVAGAVFHEYINKAGQIAEQLGRDVGVMEAIASPLAGMPANPIQVMVATIGSRLALLAGGHRGPGLGGLPGHAHWRGRHAGGDRPPEFVFGPGRGGDRVRHQQHRADRGRVAGGGVGADPDQDHVRGHEPVTGQRAVRGHGRGRGGTVGGRDLRREGQGRHARGGVLAL